MCGSFDKARGISKSPLKEIWETQPINPLLYFPIVFISIDGRPPVKERYKGIKRDRVVTNVINIEIIIFIIFF